MRKLSVLYVYINQIKIIIFISIIKYAENDCKNKRSLRFQDRIHTNMCIFIVTSTDLTVGM